MLKVLKNKTIFNLLFLLILVLAACLRIYRLNEVPKGLQADEASFLFNSTAIWQTGKNEDGQSFSLQLQSLIDPKPALYAYLQIPFLALFGVNTFASRLPSALIGLSSLVLLYLLVKKLLNNRQLALLSMFLLAISPWHIVNSRATQEVILSFTFLVANLLTFLQVLSEKKASCFTYLIFFATALLGMYSYHANKIVLLGFYGIYLFGQLFFFKKMKKKRLNQSLIVFLLTLLSFVLTAASALTRFSAIGLLGNDLPKALIFQFTTQSTGQTPLFLIRAFYNKPVFYFRYFLENYLAHFDLNYLFVNGGATKRFMVLQQGLFYFFEAIFLGLGFFELFSQKKYRQLRLLILSLIFLSPIPAALTTEEIPSSIRPFNLILPLTFLILLGLKYLFELLKKSKLLTKILVFLPIAFAYLWGLAYFCQQYLIATPIIYTTARSRHYEIVAPLIAEKAVDYDRIVFTNDLREMYIYLWQVGLISIEEVQAQPLARYKDNYQLGKFYFSQEACHFPEFEGRVLYVTPASCHDVRPESLKTVEQTYFDDQQALGFLLSDNLPRK